jgi:hypothetical protein
MGRNINGQMEGSMGNRSSGPHSVVRSRVSIAGLALGALAASAVFATGAAGVAGAASPHATAARTLNLNDTGTLTESNHHGVILKEQGSAKGTLAGTIYLQLDVTSTRTVTAEVQVYPKGGSLKGDAKASYSNQGSFASFSGTLSITGGSGTYSKAKGSGLSFTGTIKRSNDAVTVHVSGKLSY